MKDVTFERTCAVHQRYALDGASQSFFSIFFILSVLSQKQQHHGVRGEWRRGCGGFLPLERARHTPSAPFLPFNLLSYTLPRVSADLFSFSPSLRRNGRLRVLPSLFFSLSPPILALTSLVPIILAPHFMYCLIYSHLTRYGFIASCGNLPFFLPPLS